MRKITSFLLLLFMAMVVKAQTTETYDFYNFATGDGYMTTTGDAIAIDAATDATTTQYFTEIYKVQNLTIGSTTMNFNDRFAFNPVGTGWQMYWRFRNTGTTYQKGLINQWNGSKTANSTANISILGLYSGDKVTITYKTKSSAANLFFVKSGIATIDGTAVSSGDIMKSGSTYTIVAADDNTTVNLDLYITNNNIGIHTVTIVSDKVSEMAEAPLCSITGAYNGERTITITSVTEGTAGTAVGNTYYTTDGTEPSNTNGEVYNAPFSISETSTIKAITYLENGVASDVTSLEVEAGTTISLNENIVTISDLIGEDDVKNAVISNVYTSQGLIGTPEATFTYTFNGEVVTLPYTVTEEGTFIATATAEGYASTSETLEMSGGYIVAKSIDFTTVTDENLTEILGDTWSITATNTRWSGWDSSNGNIYSIATCSTPGYLTEFLGSTCGTMIVGYGVTRNHNSGTKYWINNPQVGQLALYEVNEVKKATTDFIKYVVAYSEDNELSHTIYNVNTIAKVSVYTPVRELVINDQDGLTEYPDFAPEYSSYSSVVYNRELNTGYTYGLICLPFVPDAESLENFQFYALSSAVNNQGITFEEVDVPEASRPYLYSIKEGATRTNCITGGYTTFDLTDPTAVKNFIANDNDTWELVGALKDSTINCETDPNANYAFNPVKSTLHKVNKTLTVYPYTAYVRNNTATSAATMRVYISGPTGIKEISRDDIEGFDTNGGMFDLQGRALSNPVKGQIYIEDGVKKIKK